MDSTRRPRLERFVPDRPHATDGLQQGRGIRLMGLLQQLVSAGNRLRPHGTERPSEPERPPSPDSSLFRCETCDTVYIATEKDHCSACAEPVETVPSTLHAAD